jgi:hypothetical protein
MIWITTIDVRLFELSLRLHLSLVWNDCRRAYCSPKSIRLYSFLNGIIMEQTSTAPATGSNKLELLMRLMNDAFDGNIDDLALAMGRPVEEITNWINGDEEMDTDAEMKVRGMIHERLGDEALDGGSNENARGDGPASANPTDEEDARGL